MSLRHTQAAGEEHLDDGAVALSFVCRQVDAVFESVHLRCRQVFRQMLWQVRRLKQFSGVDLQVTVEFQIVIERPHAGQDACL